jgi:hypothetical protein
VSRTVSPDLGRRKAVVDSSSLLAIYAAQRRWDLEDVSKSVNKLRHAMIEAGNAMHSREYEP